MFEYKRCTISHTFSFSSVLEQEQYLNGKVWTCSLKLLYFFTTAVFAYTEELLFDRYVMPCITFIARFRLFCLYAYLLNDLSC